ESEHAARQVAADRSELLDRLRAAGREKDRFLAMLSHELRNPLAPISSAVNVLKLSGSSQDDLEWSRGVIERQVEDLKRLIDGLLDVSRLAQNRFDLKKAPIALSDVIDAALEISQPLLDEKEHALEVRLPAEPVYVDGDHVRLAQVFMNLLVNA